MASEQWVVTDKIIQVLNALKVDYYIGGSAASGRFGEPRLTRDVDIIAALREEHVASFVSALQVEFYLDDIAMRRAIHGSRSFNLIHLETAWKIDVFIPPATSWSASKMGRRVWRALEDTPNAPHAFIASAEDIVIQKLHWYQKGGGVSDQQWRDIQGVLKVQADKLDQTYLQHWADALALRELFDRAVAEAGISI